MINRGIFLAALFLVASQTEAAEFDSARAQHRDQSLEKTIFFGGPIHTLDVKYPAPEAILIAGGKITMFGTREALEKNNPHAVMRDLNGSVMLPGFIDSHAHIRELGMDFTKANLVDVRSGAEIVARLKKHYPNPVPGQWLIGQGWDEGWFATDGYPDRRLLDEAFPENPIQLESLHGFAGFYNGAALKVAGINEQTADPEVGQILRRADGSPTGVLLTLAQNLVDRHVPAPDINTRKLAIIKGLELMASQGVTSVHEAGMLEADTDAFIALAEDNRLQIRVYGMLNGNDRQLMQRWFKRGAYLRDDAMMAVRSIKVFYDGSLGSRTALMKAPYSDKPAAANPTERITQEQVTWLAENAAQSGFQMAVHAIGDEGNDRTLSLYEKALTPYPAQDHRWRVEHAQVVLPDFFQRAASLGVIASMQSSHAVGDSGWAEARVGPKRIQYAYAWRTMLEAGVPLIINSDLPGEPWHPVQTLHFAVNRTVLDTSGASSWYPSQSLTVHEAIDAMTLSGAHAAFQDTVLGSLSIGKWADFAIVSADPYTSKPSDLKNISVVSTWVAGKQVAGK